MQVQFGQNQSRPLTFCECISTDRKEALEELSIRFQPLLGFLKERNVDVFVSTNDDKFAIAAQHLASKGFAKAETANFVSTQEVLITAITTGLNALYDGIQNERDDAQARIVDMIRITMGLPAAKKPVPVPRTRKPAAG